MENNNDQQKLRCIKGFNLLADMSQQQMMRVASLIRVTMHGRGKFVYLPGDVADAVYLLKEGRIKLATMTENGREVLLGIIEAGEIFGEVAALRDEPRINSAQALDDALVCKMQRKDFEDLLKQYPQMALQVYKQIGRRLKKTESRLVNLICKDVRTRVREKLVDLVSSEGRIDLLHPTKITITQQHIADLIGASRQETAKVLKQLEGSDIIELRYRSIIIRSPNRLCAAMASANY